MTPRAKPSASRSWILHKAIKPPQPPLFKNEKGKDVRYTYTEEQQRDCIAEMGDNVRVQRYKGLGEMDASQLAETTMSPAHRTLRRITVDDANAAEHVFEMLMGGDVAPRKEFIVQGAYRLNQEQIDA